MKTKILMKQISKNIKPGIGVGELKLGISKNKAKELLGVSKNHEKYSYTNTKKDLTETWHYSDLGINIAFDEDDNWKLGLTTVKSEPYLFENSIFIGQEKNKILLKLESLKIVDIEYENMPTFEDPTHELYSSDTLGINFWFDYDKLTEI